MKLEMQLVSRKEIETYLHPPGRRAPKHCAAARARDGDHATGWACDGRDPAGRGDNTRLSAVPGAEWRGIARTSERTFLRERSL